MATFEAPKWFNYEFYMGAKLAQMQKADPAGNWTMTKVVDAFAANNLFGEEGAYNHFMQFGAGEDVAPNANFNATEYYAAKAAQFYKVAPSAVTELQIANVKDLIAANGMNAWTHYQQFGSAEGVNPSNDFDAAAYLAAKATAMGGEWTAAKVADAIKVNGMTVLEHYMQYAGAGTDEVAKGATFPVSDANKVPSSQTGTTYELTVDRDTLVGTSLDDQFIADVKNVGGTETATLNASDSIDGGAGFDTLTVYGDDNAKNLTTASITNVEKIVAVGTIAAKTATIDVSGMNGVTEAWVKNGTSNIQVTKAQIAGFEGTVGADVTVTVKDVTGTADAATVALNGVVNGSNKVSVATGVEAQSLNLVSKNTLGTFENTSMTSLTITGDGSLASGVAATPATAVTAGSSLLKTVDASAATGDLNLSFTKAQLNATEFTYTGSKGADKLAFDAALTQKATINLGTGDDTLTLVGAPTGTGSTFNGGDGTDTLSFDFAMTAAAGKMFTGFENLKLAGTTASYEVGQIEGVTSYEVAATTASITKLAEGATVKVSAASTATLTLADNSAATSAVSVAIDNGATTVAAGFTTAINTNAHVLNLASNGLVSDLNTVTLGNDSIAYLSGITISGDQALKLTTGATTALTSIDGSSATGKLTIDASSATKGLTIKGGSADDAITGSANNDVLIGGAGNDKLIGGTGADTMTGGDGKDVFTIALTGAVSATNLDTVTDFVTKVDSLALSATAGTTANLTKATAAVADFTAALAAANKVFAADNDTVAYNVQQVGNDSYVFYAAVAEDTASNCVKLSGVALDGIVAGDIVTTA